MDREGAPGTPRRLRTAQLRADSENAICSYGNLAVSLSFKGPHGAFISECIEVVNRIATEYPDGAALLVVIDSDAPPPDTESREAILSFYRVLGGKIRVLVHVVEGVGFGSAAKRGALALMTMKDRHGYPMRVTGTVEESIPMLRKALGLRWLDAVDARGLSAVLAELRAVIEAKR